MISPVSLLCVRAVLPAKAGVDTTGSCGGTAGRMALLPESERGGKLL